MNNSSSTRTTTRGVKKVSFLFGLALVAILYLATPLTALACNGNNNDGNNSSNVSNTINIGAATSCILVDNGSGNAKFEISGQLDVKTKKALDKALSKDPNIQNNDLSHALDCNSNAASQVCILVDDGSGNAKFGISGQFDVKTKKALDKALSKDPNIQNNDLSHALDCSGKQNGLGFFGTGGLTSGVTSRPVCIRYVTIINNHPVCVEYSV